LREVVIDKEFLMNNLVRGGRISALTLLFAIFAYAGTATAEPEATLAIANDSHITTEDKTQFLNTAIAPTISEETATIENKDKKLVKTTAMVKARNAGTTNSSGSFTATAYCLKGRTALGHGVRRGIIAADPRVLRLGSTVQVSGGGYTGSYLVSDTGGAVKGRKIDIWVPSCAEARKFGRRTVQIN
jgi:3D (Asp-Asp-Asp) domain-containing protein